MNQLYPWDDVAQTYDEIRPTYPAQLIQDIIENAHLSPNDRLLEIGAGTGKATLLFAEKGYRVHCVEPGHNLAQILIRKCVNYPWVSVDVCSFEEWKPEDDMKFDLVFCAQAFDYVDPEIRYRKCHQLLKQDGYLALFWYGNENKVWETDIPASGLFYEPRVFEYYLDCTLDAETAVKAMESVSGFVLLDDDTKSRKRDEIRENVRQQDGFVNKRLNYTLYLARAINH